MVTPSAAVGGAMCHTVSGLARNRCAEVPYREDGGGPVEALLGWGGWGCLQINCFIVCDYSVWGFFLLLWIIQTSGISTGWPKYPLETCRVPHHPVSCFIKCAGWDDLLLCYFWHFCFITGDAIHSLCVSIFLLEFETRSWLSISWSWTRVWRIKCLCITDQ